LVWERVVVVVVVVEEEIARVARVARVGSAASVVGVVREEEAQSRLCSSPAQQVPRFVLLEPCCCCWFKRLGC
jgi:hypothetical protein